METINVSSLKAHISEVLAEVRAGSDYLVLDRKTPIAKLVGLDNEAIGTAQLAKKAVTSRPKPISFKIKQSALDILLEDRQRR